MGLGRHWSGRQMDHPITFQFSQPSFLKAYCFDGGANFVNASHLFVTPFCYQRDKNITSHGEICGETVAAKGMMTQREEEIPGAAV